MLLQRNGGILLAVRGHSRLPIEKIEDRLRTAKDNDVLSQHWHVDNVTC